jgi:AcrR family transcriptional regulator
MTDRPAEVVRRKKRDRARTESDLLDAAQRLFDRDGPLAGLNLNEVATEARVNRGQIYQMYGSRRALLRATLARALARLRQQLPDESKLDFAARKRATMREAIAHRELARLGTLLVLDEDDAFHVFPAFDATRLALQRDKTAGSLPADADAEALHVLTNATCLGYALIREIAARDTQIDPAELDSRVIAAYDRVIDAVTGDCLVGNSTQAEQIH